MANKKFRTVSGETLPSITASGDEYSLAIVSGIHVYYVSFFDGNVRRERPVRGPTFTVVRRLGRCLAASQSIRAVFSATLLY